MSLKPSDIDHIIKLLTQIAEALIKSDNFPLPQNRADELFLSIKKQKYFASKIEPLQEKLDVFLNPLWPEIMKLSRDNQLREDIEVFLHIKDINKIRRRRRDYLDNGVLTDKMKKVVRELRCIKAKLECQQGTTPAEPGGNAAPAKDRGLWTCIKRIPRWIYVLVIFFSAMLTCIYFSWWLWTIFWKK